MLCREKINRINELAKKKKTVGLTNEEAKEQEVLRAEYLEKFRESFKKQLDQIEFVDEVAEEIDRDEDVIMKNIKKN